MKLDVELIEFDTKAQFIGPTGINTSAQETNADKDGYVGNIPYYAICFIKDTQEIWTHGSYYYGFKAIIQPVHTKITTNWADVQSDSTAKWKLSGDNGYLKDSYGSYLIQIEHPTDNDGGIYTGYFSYVGGGGTDEEIILHRSGNNSNKRLFAKIKYIVDSVYLLICSTSEESDCTELTIKLKKII